MLPPDVASAVVRSGDRRQIILAALPLSIDESARADDGENDGDSSVAIIMFSENPRFPGIALSLFCLRLLSQHAESGKENIRLKSITANCFIFLLKIK